MRFFLRNTLYCSRENIFPKVGFPLREKRLLAQKRSNLLAQEKKAKNGISLTEL